MKLLDIDVVSLCHNKCIKSITYICKRVSFLLYYISEIPAETFEFFYCVIAFQFSIDFGLCFLYWHLTSTVSLEAAWPHWQMNQNDTVQCTTNKSINLPSIRINSWIFSIVVTAIIRRTFYSKEGTVYLCATGTVLGCDGGRYQDCVSVQMLRIPPSV